MLKVFKIVNTEVEDSNLEPKVSIALITYNHEKYIRQALEGILIQTYSNYEIVVADDCSTDTTMDIIEEYKRQFPEKFKIIKSKENLGPSRNFKRLLENCNGDYVALLDGDDFWLNPDKLEIQVRFLENHKEYVISFHQARILKMSREAKFGEFIPTRTSTQREFDIEDVMNDLFMPTASVVYRNGHIPNLPDWFSELIVCDKPLHLMNLMHGKIKYIDQCMCVYRVHEEGIWSTKRLVKNIEFDENKVKMLNYFNEYSEGKYSSQLNRAISRCETRILINSIKSLNNNLDRKVNQQKIDEIKQAMKNHFNGRKLYIFGTGEAGSNAYQLLSYCNLKLEAFFDNDETKQGTSLYGVPIVAPGKRATSESIFILVGSMYYSEIKEQLIELGLKEKKHFIVYNELLSLFDKLKIEGVS